MARAATASLRGLVGIAAAGHRRMSAAVQGRGAGPRALPGGRGFGAVASGSGGRTTPGSSSSSARPQLQLRRGAAAVRTLQRAEAAGWVSKGFESEDGKLRCGCSSFEGRRLTMEDRYDIKLTKIDGHAVSLFGVFDGHRGTFAAEYLKEHLFENLMKHPQF